MSHLFLSSQSNRWNAAIHTMITNLSFKIWKLFSSSSSPQENLLNWKVCEFNNTQQTEIRSIVTTPIRQALFPLNWNLLNSVYWLAKATILRLARTFIQTRSPSVLGISRWNPNYIVTDRIRRMGEGSVFTHVCPSICLSTPPSPDLLHGGRYASCIHAGGRSCLLYTIMWANKLWKSSGNILV